MKEENREKRKKLRYQLFVSKWNYLVDIFEKLNTLYFQFQGINTDIPESSDKVDAFCGELELEKINIKKIQKCLEIWIQHLKVLFVTIEKHLKILTKN